MKLSPEEQSEYVRFLDGQARFFNGQVTAHAGYFLTTILGSLAVFNVGNAWLVGIVSTVNIAYFSTLVSVIFFGVLVSIFLLGSFPFSPKYFYARLQYYTALSEIVWNHMPYSSQHGKDELFDVLMNRALGPLGDDGSRLGVRSAVMEFFEARLYISCKNTGSKPYELSEHEQTLFRLTEYFSQFGALDSYTKRRALLWDRTALLLLAYKDTIMTDLKSSERRRKEILQLLQPFV
ncbi:MAG TPA: hypothetical protein VE862_09330 [Candidatus Acidoferrum sp.]|nr:hypothetical protein [Candidatus Acidoferrum sp.]